MLRSNPTSNVGTGPANPTAGVMDGLASPASSRSAAITARRPSPTPCSLWPTASSDFGARSGARGREATSSAPGPDSCPRVPAALSGGRLLHSSSGPPALATRRSRALPRLHDTRHAWAVAMLRAGVAPPGLASSAAGRTSGSSIAATAATRCPTRSRGPGRPSTSGAPDEGLPVYALSSLVANPLDVRTERGTSPLVKNGRLDARGVRPMHSPPARGPDRPSRAGSISSRLPTAGAFQ